MKVKIKIRDKNLKIIDIEEYDFQEFCNLLSRKISGVLFLFEAFLSKDELKKEEYKTIRNKILDVSGYINRLPNTIEFDKKGEDGD